MNLKSGKAFREKNTRERMDNKRSKRDRKKKYKNRNPVFCLSEFRDLSEAHFCVRDRFSLLPNHFSVDLNERKTTKKENERK